jgi:hypothetical protein
MMSDKNWRIAVIFNGPRQMVGVSISGNKKSMETILIPNGPVTGKTPEEVS